MTERESKWWCGGCGDERDISVSACPKCESTVLTSLPLQPQTGNTAKSSIVVRGAV